MDIILQVLVNGLLLGGLYGLVAMGLTLVFGVMGVINVAHGDLMVIAAVATYLLSSKAGLPPYIALLAVIPVMFAAGVVIQRVLLERITGSEELMSLLLLFGFGIAITQTAAQFIGGSFFSVPYWTDSWHIGSIRIPESLGYSSFTALVLAGLLFYFLRRSPYGRAIRATSSAPELAAATGVDVRRVRAITFGIGTALAGASGTLMVTTQALNPLSGHVFLLIAFAACVLGGLGSVGGALAAGFILGIIEVGSSQLVNSQFSQMAIYIAFIGILLIRPSGIFQRASA